MRHGLMWAGRFFYIAGLLAFGALFWLYDVPVTAGSVMLALLTVGTIAVGIACISAVEFGPFKNKD